MEIRSRQELALADYIRPGDCVYWGEGSGEPTALVEQLVAQRAALGGISVFLGMNVSGLMQPEYADHLKFRSYGALVTVARLQKAGVLTLMPCNYSALPRLIRSNKLAIDVAMVQLSPPGPDGTHSLGLSNAAMPAAIEKARVVIAEINSQVPWTHTDYQLDPSCITVAIESDQPPPEMPVPTPGDADRAIGRHLAALVPNGATLQYGIGGIPTALLSELGNHQHLGLHTGLFTDPIVDLVESGVIDNSRKPTLPGVSVAAFAIGSERLRRFLHNNASISVRQLDSTHGAASLSQIDNLVAINSALEVDLFGQVNAEQVGSRYVGTIGGQVDFMHAASTSENGFSVIALPSVIPGKQTSRITAKLNGPFVTTARADVDIVVTEHGVADLRGLSVAERVQQMIRIAAPEHRDALTAAAQDAA